MTESATFVMEPTHLMDDDSQLVQAAQVNPAAFKKLYQKWLTPIYRYFYFRVGNQKEAEDLTSQVFLKAYESLPGYRDRGNFAAWLFSIAHSRVVDYYRKSARSQFIQNVDEIDPPDLQSDPLSQITKQDEIRQVMKLLNNCSEEEQEMLRLRYMAELNYRQIGSILNKSEDAVRKTMFRLIHRLQAQLEGKND